ncbi:MAG TPA: TolC family protein [Acidobacteriaceae bacterium]|nr:TolC family protein [Acidobacteriaceae bacterium]
MRICSGKLFSLVFLVGGVPLLAQQAAGPPPRPFTVQEAVDYALAHYPAVQASLEQYNSARAGVGLARTDWLPSLEGVWQGDRGSRESVLGVLLPQYPNILTGTQGSVTAHSNRPFWTSGAGVLLSWEPFTFGYRHAEIRSAIATEQRTQQQVTLTRLGVTSAVAEASLALLADEQRVAASQADLDRRQVFARSVHALVDARLRPGADASRADAEVATSRTRLIEAQRDEQVGSIALAQVLGLAGSSVSIQSGPFLAAPPDATWAEPPASRNPAALVQQGRVDEEKAKIRVLNHAWYPHLTPEALLSARGSAEQSNGSDEPGLNGLGFSAYNWEAGLTAQMDLTGFFAIHERKKVEVANWRQQEQLYTQTLQTVTTQQQTALADLDGARRVAQNTPVELEASRQGELQATARFRAGLGTSVDVAEAQDLLAEAEMDDSLARLSIWRALAELASANGDLTPFLSMAAGTPAGGH